MIHYCLLTSSPTFERKLGLSQEENLLIILIFFNFTNNNINKVSNSFLEVFYIKDTLSLYQF